jgi:hypothetical protein
VLKKPSFQESKSRTSGRGKEIDKNFVKKVMKRERKQVK